MAGGVESILAGMMAGGMGGGRGMPPLGAMQPKAIPVEFLFSKQSQKQLEAAKKALHALDSNLVTLKRSIEAATKSEQIFSDMLKVTSEAFKNNIASVATTIEATDTSLKTTTANLNNFKGKVEEVKKASDVRMVIDDEAEVKKSTDEIKILKAELVKLKTEARKPQKTKTLDTEDDVEQTKILKSGIDSLVEHLEKIPDEMKGYELSILNLIVSKKDPSELKKFYSKLEEETAAGVKNIVDVYQKGAISKEKAAKLLMEQLTPRGDSSAFKASPELAKMLTRWLTASIKQSKFKDPAEAMMQEFGAETREQAVLLVNDINTVLASVGGAQIPIPIPKIPTEAKEVVTEYDGLWQKFVNINIQKTAEVRELMEHAPEEMLDKLREGVSKELIEMSEKDLQENLEGLGKEGKKRVIQAIEQIREGVDVQSNKALLAEVMKKEPVFIKKFLKELNKDIRGEKGLIKLMKDYRVENVKTAHDIRRLIMELSKSDKAQDQFAKKIKASTTGLGQFKEKAKAVLSQKWVQFASFGTALGFFAKAIHNYTKGMDDMNEAVSKVSGTFFASQGDILAYKASIIKLQKDAASLNIPFEEYDQLQKKIRNDVRVNVVVQDGHRKTIKMTETDVRGLTKQTAILARTLGVDTATVLDYVTKQTMHYGVSTEEAMNQLAGLKGMAAAYNDMTGESIIKADEFTKDLMDLSEGSKYFAMDLKFAGRMLLAHSEQIRQSGGSYQLAKDSAKSFMDLLSGKGPAWTRLSAGQKLLAQWADVKGLDKDAFEKKFAELTAGIDATTPEGKEKLDKLKYFAEQFKAGALAGGDFAFAEILEESFRGTEAGMQAHFETLTTVAAQGSAGLQRNFGIDSPILAAEIVDMSKRIQKEAGGNLKKWVDQSEENRAKHAEIMGKANKDNLNAMKGGLKAAEATAEATEGAAGRADIKIRQIIETATNWATSSIGATVIGLGALAAGTAGMWLRSGKVATEGLKVISGAAGKSGGIISGVFSKVGQSGGILSSSFKSVMKVSKGLLRMLNPIRTVMIAMKGLGTAAKFLISPWGLAIVAGAALCIILYKMAGGWKGITSAVSTFGKGFMESFQPAIDMIKKEAVPIIESFKSIWDSMFGGSGTKQDLTSFGMLVGNVLGSVALLFGSVLKVVAWALDKIAVAAKFWDRFFGKKEDGEIPKPEKPKIAPMTEKIPPEIQKERQIIVNKPTVAKPQTTVVTPKIKTEAVAGTVTPMTKIKTEALAGTVIPDARAATVIPTRPTAAPATAGKPAAPGGATTITAVATALRGGKAFLEITNLPDLIAAAQKSMAIA